jgi:signal transduction histidine kinase
VLGAVAVLGRGGPDRGAVSIAVWVAFCAVSNVLPVPAVRNVYLSMSGPVNVAIAALFAPGTAALVVAAGSVSEWELRRATTPSHAVYNRAQLAISTAAASAALRVAGPLGAVVTYQVVNWGLVAAAEATCRGVPFRRVVRGLLPTHPVAAGSYFVLGLTGIALAATYDRVGAWAVVLLMLPLLGARQAVAAFGEADRAQRAQRALAVRLIDERERERARIAADIHDVVLQELAGLQLAANNVRSAISAGRGEQAYRLAAGLEGGVHRTIVSLRDSLVRLRRNALDEAGLSASVARYARSFAAQSGLDVRVVEVTADDVPLPVALLLYEACVEALTNVARHADARSVTVAIRRTGDAAELEVADDGAGMRGAPGTGLGLLREKVELAGGRLAVTVRPRGGTEVAVRVPTGPAW